MKNRKLYYLIITGVISLVLYFINNSQGNETKTIALDNSFNFLPSTNGNQLVKHDYYTLSYSEKHEQAAWVAYELTPQHLKKINRKRPYFIYDDKVTTKSANYRNYKKSGYDRGHLVPAGDMRFSLEAYNDTFFTSNISPQNHQFNAGVWNRLEQKVRYWTKKYGKIYVITGGVLSNNLKTIGKEHVSVPDFFYKIILDNSKDNPKIIAFLIPHKKSDKPLYSFVTSVDSIEKLTGIDFFAALPNTIENELESNSNYKKWSFR